MQVYKIMYSVVEIHEATVRAESESAARQAWVEGSLDTDEIVDSNPNLMACREVRPVTAADRLIDLEVEYGLTNDDDWISGSGRSIDYPLEATPYVLIERNTHASNTHWATTHDSIDEAQEYHEAQEYPDDWYAVKIVNLLDGRVWHPVPVPATTHWVQDAPNA
jgi:hypothetical protein